jgi:putative FmdB family regulatory protein
VPIYAYRCQACAYETDVFKSVALLDRLEECPCGLPMARQVTAAMVRPDLPGYDCPITGKWVEGRRQHEENLARHGCRILEPGETSQRQATARREEAELDNKIEETAAAFVEALPPAKQEQLACELDRGFDVSLERG